jgi:hypothetical protein
MCIESFVRVVQAGFAAVVSLDGRSDLCDLLQNAIYLTANFAS